ncbi:unnamed protein product [Fraxinus pennsylvanica]|uniref:C3H1-type domain-containing protein n=1 Tax=Fraxinus pennsylvanica TaxID=56036 RepID=A0AAD1YZP0_9LAMI|nr:unnamed protein product [Fraxinus pennsylvanica]
MNPSSSTAAVNDPLLATSHPLTFEIDDDVEMEYEDAEEVGKEVEIEEEKDDDFGEDLTPIREENNLNDPSRVTGPEEHLKSGLVTSRKHVTHPLPDIPTVLGNTGKLKVFESSEDGLKAESCGDGKRTLKDCDEKPFCDSRGRMNALNSKDYAAANTMQMSQRLNVSQTRPRDFSSNIELTGGIKRQRIACEFHAKGWCIKGNTCRFLHIKEGAVDASTGHLTRTSFDDWEPSVPFRPSHFITQKLLSQANLHDPVRDSIEPTKVRDGVSKISGGDVLHSTGDIDPKAIVLSSSRDSGKQGESIRMTEPDLGKVSQKNEHSGYLQKESKEMKHFRAVLVEHVKDLVKPTWLEGLLSKDAHKLIVKKAVDKILSSFQPPHQIPSTGESIKSYLYVSQPKIEKLVEGYIEKYGKS